MGGMSRKSLVCYEVFKILIGMLQITVYQHLISQEIDICIIRNIVNYHRLYTYVRNLFYTELHCLLLCCLYELFQYRTKRSFLYCVLLAPCLHLVFETPLVVLVGQKHIQFPVKHFSLVLSHRIWVYLQQILDQISIFKIIFFKNPLT